MNKKQGLVLFFAINLFVLFIASLSELIRSGTFFTAWIVIMGIITGTFTALLIISGLMWLYVWAGEH